MFRPHAPQQVLLAHAQEDVELADRLAAPLHEQGYDVVYHRNIEVGKSLQEKSSALLAQGVPVVVVATAMALGKAWIHRVVHAARSNPRCRLFFVQMSEDVYLDQLGKNTISARPQSSRFA